MGALGRRVPEDFEHVSKYPLRALLADPTHELVVPPESEKSLGLPWWWKQHDQGARSSCVGHGESMERSLTNHYQRLRETGQDVTYRYDANWLYDEALQVDEWPGTADEGTSLRAGYEVLVMRGHRRMQRGVSGPEMYEHGVTTFRWAQNVDEIRSALYAGLAVAVGWNWYASFDLPWQRSPGGDRWISIAPGSNLRGGHCLAIYRYSDSREAFRLVNSWNNDWPPSWISYEDVTRLFSEHGEAAVVTDR